MSFGRTTSFGSSIVTASCRRGSAGHIVGWFARDEPTYVVSFDGEQPCVVVRSDEIVLKDDVRRSA